MLPSAHFVMQDDLVVSGGLIVEAAAAAAIAASNQKKKTRPRGRFFHRRPRHSIHDVYTWMGESIFRCAFRMTYDSFWRLYDILFPHIITVMERSSRLLPSKGRKMWWQPFAPASTQRPNYFEHASWHGASVFRRGVFIRHHVCFLCFVFRGIKERMDYC
jgi:hypothetical protein